MQLLCYNNSVRKLRVLIEKVIIVLVNIEA